MANSKHLKFKGVPIDGTLEQFVARMKRKGGFVCKGINDGVAVLVGDFADVITKPVLLLLKERLFCQ